MPPDAPRAATCSNTCCLYNSTQCTEAGCGAAWACTHTAAQQRHSATVPNARRDLVHIHPMPPASMGLLPCREVADLKAKGHTVESDPDQSCRPCQPRSCPALLMAMPSPSPTADPPLVCHATPGPPVTAIATASRPMLHLTMSKHMLGASAWPHSSTISHVTKAPAPVPKQYTLVHRLQP